MIIRKSLLIITVLRNFFLILPFVAQDYLNFISVKKLNTNTHNTDILVLFYYTRSDEFYSIYCINRYQISFAET